MAQRTTEKKPHGLSQGQAACPAPYSIENDLAADFEAAAKLEPTPECFSPAQDFDVDTLLRMDSLATVRLTLDLFTLEELREAAKSLCPRGQDDAQDWSASFDDAGKLRGMLLRTAETMDLRTLVTFADSLSHTGFQQLGKSSG